MVLSLKNCILKRLGCLQSLLSDQRRPDARDHRRRNAAATGAPRQSRLLRPPSAEPDRPSAATMSPPVTGQRAREPSAATVSPPVTGQRACEPSAADAAPPVSTSRQNTLSVPQETRRSSFARGLQRNKIGPVGAANQLLSAGALAAPSAPDPEHLRLVRNRRLMKEYRDLTRNCARQADPLFTVELVNDCLYDWRIFLRHVDTSSDLHRDLQDLGIDCIEVSMVFPENFPFAPPFVQILSPRMERGFVMEEGVICMELLTPRGWASAYTIEAIIMQLAASIVKGQGRVDRRRKKPKLFSRRSAETSFKNIVKTHDKYGWVTPPLAEG